MGATLYAGEVLGPGQSLRSPNGLYTLVFERQGRLTLKYASARIGETAILTELWDSETRAPGPSRLRVIPGGQLQIHSPRPGGPDWFWWRPVFPRDAVAGSYLVVQDDGNVVLRRPTGDGLTWSTDTWRRRPPEHAIVPGAIMVDMSDGGVVRDHGGKIMTNETATLVCVYDFAGDYTIIPAGESCEFAAPGALTIRSALYNLDMLSDGGDADQQDRFRLETSANRVRITELPDGSISLTGSSTEELPAGLPRLILDESGTGESPELEGS